MNTFTHTTMSKLATIVFIVLFALTLAGCETGREAPYVPPTQEIVSPTGCLNSEGRYFDPKTKQCVKAENLHQAQVLNTYRYVNRLVEEGKVNEAEFVIYFKTRMTVNQAESLWSELHVKGARMLVFGGALPEGRKYDPESGFQSTKIWGETGTSVGCGWHSSFDIPPEEETLKSMLLASIKTMEEDTFLGPAHARPQLRKAIFEDNDCRLESMKVTANPTVIRDFWNNHLDEIEAIQPEINDLDRIQTVLGPVQPLKEGE